MSIATWGWLILALPLAGALSIALGFRLLSNRVAGIIGTGAIAAAFACTVAAVIALQAEPESARVATSSLWNYAVAGGIDIQLGILVDPLALYMALVVTGISTMIHLYSAAYMVSDQGYNRFFSYLNFFVFSMLLLILAGNFALLIVGWAFVGFASYALISFWYRRTTATRAGMKAFVINVVGDIGLMLAAFLILRELGTLEYLEVFDAAGERFSSDQWSVVAICLLLLVGAFAKSAQLPLHTWLPDAMEGPTPVSALIHAATMVTAGVYLIARTHPLFELAPTAADIAAFTGLATLLIAGTIALVMTDLKRAIAYSTMSQIGYMILGVSIGAYGAGLFHLMTHAFFKALLFMAAGSIIAAMANRQNIDSMRGFIKAMPFTAAMLVVGALALAAFPGTSGFFSKDEIIAFAAERGGMFTILEIGMYVGALLTAVYTFRLVFRVLPGQACAEAQHLIDTGEVVHAEPVNPATGEPEDTEVGFPGAEHHIAEQALGMRIAMGVLGFGALFAGLVQVPGLTHLVGDFLAPTFAGSIYADIHLDVGKEWVGLGIGALISLVGIAIVHRVYLGRPGTSARLQARFGAIHTLLERKWYFDELIDRLVVRPVLWVGGFADRVFERRVVDGLVELATGLVGRAGAGVRGLQSGFVRGYMLLLFGGLLLLGLYFLAVSG
ncbi:MAG TPA: NADH-quinone oxidoreductase subunit L [Solirubrobacterales bacterium]|nr:NADH-quinone oxidoreductase subunit L [Solirubrobacterales bacterium]